MTAWTRLTLAAPNAAAGAGGGMPGQLPPQVPAPVSAPVPAPVPVRVLARVPASDPAAAELRRASAVRHEHLIPLCLEDTGDGSLGLARHDAVDRRLGELLEVAGTLGHGPCVTVVVPIARAVAALHEAGLVAGVVTPNDVQLDAAGRPMLALATAPRACPAEEPGRREAHEGDVRTLATLGWWLLAGTPPAEEGPPLLELAPGAPRPLLALLSAVLDAPLGGLPSAAQFASLLLDACTPEPLPALTPAAHRLDGPVTLGGSPAREGRAAGASGTEGARAAEVDDVAHLRFIGPDSDAVRRSTRLLPLGLSRPRRGRRRRSRPVTWRVGVATGAALVAASLAAAAVAIARPSGSGRHPLPAVPAALSTAETVAVQAHPASQQPVSQWSASPRGTRSPEAPIAQRDWRAVLDALDATRAAAFRTISQGGLNAVYLPGAPAGARDAALLAAYRRDGAHVEGLRTELSSVRVALLRGGEVRLVVRDRLAAYVVVRRDGDRLSQPGRGLRDWSVELRRSANGQWRVWDVRPASGGGA